MGLSHDAPRLELAQLRERYRQRSGGTIAAIGQLAEQLAQRPAAPEVIDALRKELHRLRGTAGSYGFVGASRLAEALEGQAVAWAADPGLAAEHRGQIVARFAEQLRAALLEDESVRPEVSSAGDATAQRSAGSAPVPVPPTSAAQTNGDRSPFASLTAPVGLPGSTVLVLDDDPMVLELVDALLASETVRVVRCSDPEQLPTLLAATHPALLMLDMNLGATTGIALTREVRAVPAYRDLPIILFSGNTTPDVREAAYAAGADEFIGKPLVAAELQHRITEQLARIRLQRVERGLHPATGLPQHTRLMRDAAAAFATIRARQRPCTAILVRPTSPGTAAAATAAWFDEIGRIARAFAPTAAAVGHDDDVSLLLVLEGSAEHGATICASVHAARPTGAPAWHAAVVDSTEAEADNVAALRLAAAELLADTSTHEWLVVRWQADAARRAPEVVIVEDDAALAEMLEYAMRTAGVSYRVFTDGVTALDQLLAMQVHGTRPVVLLDVNLPGIDGHSLYERLRVERPGVFSVVFMTVRTAEVEQLRALRGGAVDYLAKPINLRILMAKLPGWLGRPVETT